MSYAKPLEGVKIVEISTIVTASLATMMMADQGAEVIKVEPTNGEQLRHMAAPHNGVNPAFFFQS